jgi:hypothetical protein
LDKAKLQQLEDNFTSFISPLLDKENPEDYHFIWEFQKFYHSKKLQVITARNEEVKRWKALLLSK